VLNQTNIRSAAGKILDPAAGALLRVGLTPDMVTVIGTVGVSVAALVFFPNGQFVIGVLVIVLFIFSDMLDGAMARQQKRTGPWGAFLDSTLDRVADGFIFGALLIWAVNTQANTTVAAALICLVGGFVVSYAKARAEGLGMTCNVGVAERSERLIIALASAFVYGLGVAYVLPAGLWVLALLTLLTVAQRFAVVHRQAMRVAQTDNNGQRTNDGNDVRSDDDVRSGGTAGQRDADPDESKGSA